MEERTFTIGSRLAEIEPVQEEIKQILQTAGFRLKQIHAALLALGEWLEHVVQNYPANGAPGTVTIELWVEEAEVRFRVSDDSPELAFSDVPRPDAQVPVTQRNTAGLNLHLMRSLVDQVEFHRTDGRNVLELVKQLIPST